MELLMSVVSMGPHVMTTTALHSTQRVFELMEHMVGKSDAEPSEVRFQLPTLTFVTSALTCEHVLC